MAAMTGPQFLAYCKLDFKRSDKDTELYSAMTDAVRDMKQAFEFDSIKVEKNTTATISVLGNYTIANESDLGLYIGDVVLRDGTNSYVLKKLSKEDFDVRFPNPQASSVLRGRPRYWCSFGGNILIGPVPDRTNYQYHISYTVDDGSSIDGNTASVPFTPTYRECLKYGTLARAYKGVENDQEAQEQEALYEAALVKAIRRERLNNETIKETYYNGI